MPNLGIASAGYIGGSSQIADASITEAKLLLADNTTANASTTKHGFLKKLDNTATNFMNGAGNWAAPSGGTLVKAAVSSIASSRTSAQLNAITATTPTLDASKTYLVIAGYCCDYTIVAGGTATVGIDIAGTTYSAGLTCPAAGYANGTWVQMKSCTGSTSYTITPAVAGTGTWNSGGSGNASVFIVAIDTT